MSRRTFLRRVGVGAGALVVVTAAGAVWRSVDQSVLAPGSGEAYDPWRADLDGPPPMSLVAAAVLAASAHNTQPWAFHVTDDRITLFADRERTMGSMDPLGRELQLSLGCALENLVLAARAHGRSPSVTPVADPRDPDRVAMIDLSPGRRDPSPLFQAIPKRHTNRAAYETDRPLEPGLLHEMSGLADQPDVTLVWLTARADMDRFAAATTDATSAILADAEQAKDDLAWYRQDWHEIQRQRDGITMDAAGLGEPIRILLRLLPGSSQTDLQQGWLDATRDRHLATAAAYGLVLVRDRADPGQLLHAGRLLQRTHLFATDRQLALQPLNQLLERVDREAASSAGTTFTRIASDLTPPGWSMVTAFRIGHPTAAPALSPRRPPAAVTRP